MALVHLNQLRPVQTVRKDAAQSSAPPPASAAPPVDAAVKASPPAVPAPAAPGPSWGAYSQRLLDKLDTIERAAADPLQGGTTATLRPDRN